MQDSAVQANNVCGNCLHYIGPTDRCDKTQGMCYFGAKPCKYFESPNPLCGNCVHFLGGDSWYLCCDIKKDIVGDNEEACESYERI